MSREPIEKAILTAFLGLTRILIKSRKIIKNHIALRDLNNDLNDVFEMAANKKINTSKIPPIMKVISHVE